MSDLVSYNVKGIINPIKRKKILTQLKKLNCSIGLLQDTHLNEVEHKKLRRDWVALIIGTVGGVELTIVNIYAPNEDDPTFFEVASVTAREARGTIILGGDFNCVLNVKMDKLASDYGPPSRKSKAAKHMLEELGLVDVGEPRIQQQKISPFCL